MWIKHELQHKKLTPLDSYVYLDISLNRNFRIPYIPVNTINNIIYFLIILGN